MNYNFVKIKSTLGLESDWVYCKYNRISAIVIKNDSYRRIEPAYPFLAVRLKQYALTIPQIKHTTGRNNKEYIDRWSHFVAAAKKIIN